MADGSPSTGEFIIYRTDDDRTEVHLRVIEGSVWMTQAEIAELFDVSRSSVSEHLRTIFNTAELERAEVVRKFRKEPGQGGRRLDHYKLDAIMAVGYRVRGPRGAQFRSWATEVLKEYLVKGFAMNDEKLKDPRGLDYFDELLERIRDIRASEARFYSQILDVIATAVDYQKGEDQNRVFFGRIQNKLHFAVTGQTAAEILVLRANPSEPNMGLTNFKGARVRKRDVTVAKNYLLEGEMRTLNRLSTMFLDYAQLQAEQRKQMTLSDWEKQADKFIDFNDFPVLDDAGRITKDQADAKAIERFEAFDAARTRSEAEAMLEEQVHAMQRIEKDILAQTRRLGRRGGDVEE
ncbi:RhuM family protein [Corynebacterium sp. NPDC060344]|uniref:RhuM family protein n=1 Tax=Corynebacterium sp. NPDC060344 TaxID=3347101 RepID=UPI0036649EE9